MKIKKPKNVVILVLFLFVFFASVGVECYGQCICKTQGNNTFLGLNAGSSNTTGRFNTFLGCSAGRYNTEGFNNTFVGHYAGRDNIGSPNTGSYNTFIGTSAGRSNTLGVRNTFLGGYAGYSTTGSSNTFVGYRAGYATLGGSFNTFLGHNAGDANTTGQDNTFIGYAAGHKNVNGTCNTFVGDRAGNRNVSGNNNTFLGYQAGYFNTSGSGNVFVGYQAGRNINPANNKLYIANGSTDSNVLIYGDFATRTVGIATTTLNPNPTSTLRLVVGGKVRAEAFDLLSDVRLKSEVMTIKNALDQICNLRGVTFRWKDGETDDGQHLGVIGQEVEKVFPEVVSTDNNGYKSVAYSNLVAPLIEAVKELKAENETLKARIEALEGKMKD